MQPQFLPKDGCGITIGTTFYQIAVLITFLNMQGNQQNNVHKLQINAQCLTNINYHSFPLHLSYLSPLQSNDWQQEEMGCSNIKIRSLHFYTMSFQSLDINTILFVCVKNNSFLCTMPRLYVCFPLSSKLLLQHTHVLTLILSLTTCTHILSLSVTVSP